MIIILSAAFLTLLGIGLAFLAEKLDHDGGGWFMFAAIFGLIFIVMLIVCPIFYQGIKSEILQFKSVEQSLAIARANSNVSEFELAALQQKVIEMNQRLAAAHFWAKHPLTNWYWPKEIFDLKPIQ